MLVKGHYSQRDPLLLSKPTMNPPLMHNFFQKRCRSCNNSISLLIFIHIACFPFLSSSVIPVLFKYPAKALFILNIKALKLENIFSPLGCIIKNFVTLTFVTPIISTRYHVDITIFYLRGLENGNLYAFRIVCTKFEKVY